MPKLRVEELLPYLRVVSGPNARGEYICWCPFHADGQGKPPHQANLRVCDKGFVCDACGAKGGLSKLAEQINYQPPEKAGHQPLATYDYTDEEGKLLYQVCRFANKVFRQRRPNDLEGGWIWDLKGVKRVLYNLPALVNMPEDIVYIVEGEKDADNLAACGLLGVTNSGGAGKWQDSYSENLRDRQCVILPDNDEPGRLDAAQKARSLYGKAAYVRILKLEGLEEKGDVSDWLKAGGTAEALSGLALAAPEWRPAARERRDRNIISYQELLEGGEPKIDWLIRSILPASGLAVLAGDPGCGKTWLLFHMAQCVASGRPLFGRFECQQGPVLVWDEEGAQILARLRMSKLHKATDLAADLPISFFIGQGLKIDDESGQETLLEAAKELRPVLIMGDSLVRIHSSDENSATEMAKIFSLIKALQRETGAAFLFTHHLRKPGLVQMGAAHRLRGSTDILAAVDSHLELRKISNVQLLMEQPKNRYEEVLEPFTVGFDDFGGEITLNYQGLAGETMEGIQRAQQIVIDTIVEAGEAVLRTDLMEALAASKIKGRTAGEAISRLEKEGQIIKAGWLNRKRLYSLPPEGMASA